ncbi:MAG: hypothetical protein OIF50_17145 [Flavobacteriaceae bacterium]|nr:hypothetical protein [Flavobacteriaceae bacterium]
MKKVIQIVLWAASLFVAYMIYQSINAPIKFEKVKQERYVEVINRLKDIRDAQEAHRVIHGDFAKDFPSLIKFIENDKFTILEKKDSTFMYYDKVFRIDMPKDTVVIDTLDFVPVKDSLFKNDPRYKELMFVPNAKNNEHFKMQIGKLDRGDLKIPVFEASVNKDVILHDQDKDLLAKENATISVDGVNGDRIYVGSLTDVSTSGNWPTLYDTKKNKN